MTATMRVDPFGNSEQPPGSLPQGRGGSLAGLFPDADYRLQMRFQRGRIADSFHPWREPANVLELRRHWLRDEPDACSALLPDGEPLLEEWIGRSKGWGFEPLLPPLGSVSAMS